MPAEPTREEIIAQARLWLGTPFRHQGRVRGVGCDCAGLLVGVGLELGVELEDMARYAHAPDPRVLREYLARQLVPIRRRDAQAADVLLMKFGQGDATHLALRTDIGLLHAYAPARRVVETVLAPDLASCVVNVLRFPWLR